MEMDYDSEKTKILVDGFLNRFDIGYRGPLARRHKSKNIPFTVGSPVELWNKVMKEVKEGCYAGPYQEQDLPFENFV